MLDFVKTERKVTREGYRLDGRALLNSRYSIRSSENVVTFYDGVGLNSTARESELVTTYNLGVSYDLELASVKRNRINNSIMQRSIEMKMRLFNSLNALFPAFNRAGASVDRRAFLVLLPAWSSKGYTKKH